MANIGWAVVHALWQITAIGGATALALALLRRRAPETRHTVAWSGLVMMAAVPLVTACLGETSVGWTIRRTVVMSADPRVDLGPLVERLPGVARDAALLWLAGAALGLIRLAIAWRRAQSLRTSRTQDVEADVRVLVTDVARSMAIRSPIDVRYALLVRGPMVVGWSRPCVLLPVGVMTSLSTAEFRSVMAHELAHVRRRDYIANLAQSVIDRLLFFHPAAWWVSARVREEREYCCDAAAIALGRDPACFARALAALENARAIDGLAVAAVSGTLLQRIQRIAGRDPGRLTPVRGLVLFAASWTIAAVLLALAITVPPSLPPGSKLRRRTPAPNGAASLGRPVPVAPLTPGGARRSR
jgi:bla regulator protein BlaR1